MTRGTKGLSRYKYRLHFSSPHENKIVIEFLDFTTLEMERTFTVGSGAESDLEIHCEDSTFHVHRSMLSLASPVWDRMLNGAFKESTSSTIVFEQDSPRALNYLLELIYFSKYSWIRGSEAEVEALLDKYQLSDVRVFIAMIKSKEVEVDHLRTENCELQQKLTVRNSANEQQIGQLQIRNCIGI